MSTATLDPTAVRRWKRYPEYRETEIDWFGMVPNHWRILKGRLIGSLLSNRACTELDTEEPNAIPFYKVDDLNSDTGKLSLALAASWARPCEPLRSTGQIILFPKRGAAIFTNKARIVREPILFDPNLMAWAINSENDTCFMIYSLLARGLADLADVASVPQINNKHIYPAMFPIPPLSEQRAIAAFLDRETARIDALIARKERLIELLEEKRQAVISHAVTRGLDPSVPMKESGVPWLGKVPAHWEVTRLKFLLRTPIEQGWSPVCDNRTASEDEWAVLKVGCVNGHYFDPTEHKTLPEGVAPETRWLVRAGDVLMSRGNTRELVGSAALVSDIGPRVLLCDLLYRFRLRSNQAHSEFIVRALRTRYVRDQIESRAEGASPSMRKISQEDIKELILVIPPVSEQKQITSRIRLIMRRTDEMLARTHDGIARLREYRTALISAAVTGQIDVRGEPAT